MEEQTPKRKQTMEAIGFSQAVKITSYEQLTKFMPEDELSLLKNYWKNHPDNVEYVSRLYHIDNGPVFVLIPSPEGKELLNFEDIIFDTDV